VRTVAVGAQSCTRKQCDCFCPTRTDCEQRTRNELTQCISKELAQIGQSDKVLFKLPCCIEFCLTAFGMGQQFLGLEGLTV